MKTIMLATTFALGLGLATTTIVSAAEVNATIINEPAKASTAFTETFSARCRWVEVCKHYWHPHCRMVKVCRSYW